MVLHGFRFEHHKADTGDTVFVVFLSGLDVIFSLLLSWRIAIKNYSNFQLARTKHILGGKMCYRNDDEHEKEKRI